LVAVRVILTQYLTNDTGAFAVRGVGANAHAADTVFAITGGAPVHPDSRLATWWRSSRTALLHPHNHAGVPYFSSGMVTFGHPLPDGLVV
jgi:hypothetical protein